MKYLTREQIAQLLATPWDPLERLLLRVLYRTGCRVSEALAITPRDIVRESRIVVLPALKQKKGAEPKRVVIDRETILQMEVFIKARQIRLDQPIFPIERWRAWEIVKRAGAAVGIEGLHPHTLRHSFAVHWAESGGDLLKLQRQLGHKKLSTTTDMYIHYSTADIARDYDKLFPEGGKR